MKLIFPTLCLLLGAASASGQVHQTQPFQSTGGWGSVAFPGTGHPPASGYVNPGRHAGQVEVRSGSRAVYRRGNAAYAYPYPVYVGGYAESTPSTQDPGYPAYGSAMGPPPTPTVIINQNFAAPAEPAAPVETVHVYSGARQPLENAVPEPQYYLIALNDHSIYSAVAYWVESGTLHYITTPNIRNQTSLDLVDMALTTKLNQDRGVSMSLPPAH